MSNLVVDGSRMWSDLMSLAQITEPGRPYTRRSFSPEFERGREFITGLMTEAGLECRIDAGGNLIGRRGGTRPELGSIRLGSHSDTVPEGGRFDGIAGVLAAIAVARALGNGGPRLLHDLEVVDFLAEEPSDYGLSCVGSRAMSGMLDDSMLAMTNADGESLAQAIARIGGDPQAIGRQPSAAASAFFELHIEQGPVLVGQNAPMAVVTGIRGCRRLRHARCIGAYGHSGALPRAYRQDAVAATVALLSRVEAEWLRAEAVGADLVVTTGEFTTDPAQHGPSKVAGETRFVVDIRSVSDATMNLAEARARAHAAEVAATYRIRFDLGAASYSPPAAMDPGLQAALRDAVRDVGAAPFSMASGAGHDAAVFAGVGVPTAMLFVRNQNGSHNPDEAMDLADFALATRALSLAVSRMAG